MAATTRHAQWCRRSRHRRTTYFALPAPDTFTGDAPSGCPPGPLRDYAWTWGDALFVTIDPHWHFTRATTTACPATRSSDAGGDDGRCAVSMAQAHAGNEPRKYKFVFEHHVLGTGRGRRRHRPHVPSGGGFTTRTGRPTNSARCVSGTWAKPIHQLLDDTGVTIVFSAHDHPFAREKVDNVIYQSVPNPADNTTPRSTPMRMFRVACNCRCALVWHRGRDTAQRWPPARDRDATAGDRLFTSAPFYRAMRARPACRTAPPHSATA